jgi:hypothetical protein
MSTRLTLLNAARQVAFFKVTPENIAALKEAIQDAEAEYWDQDEEDEDEDEAEDDAQ